MPGASHAGQGCTWAELCSWSPNSPETTTLRVNGFIATPLRGPLDRYDVPLISANIGHQWGGLRGETRVFISSLEDAQNAASLSPHVMVSKQLFNLLPAWDRASIHPQPMG